MRIVIYILVFILTFLVAFPKDKVYDFIQYKLSKYDIQIVSGNKNITPININISYNNIYLSEAKIAKIKNIDIKIYKLEATNISFEGAFKQIVPKIDKFLFCLKLNNFLHITGNFGKVTGDIDIDTKKIILKANISQNIYNQYKEIFRIFKKSKNQKQEYIYEFTF